ncbi:MAG TPA: ArsR family transcriptional regulator [Dehalococcoidia bacterium]|nr:ArsR family transcriptional regulator [Dehalococcoidia bacterium]
MPAAGSQGHYFWYLEDVEGTRTRIVELLRQRGRATVEDLTRVLDLAPATVRRHLDVLQRDGQVALEAVRRATGRPHYVFTLTESGRSLVSGHYIGSTLRVVGELLALRPSDTRGKDGKGIALLTFERLTATLLRACERRVTAIQLPERLREAVDALAEGGVVVETVAQQGGYLLRVRDCPCRWADSTRAAACSQAESLLAGLLKAPIQRQEGEGPDVCAYFVTLAAAPAKG